MFKYFFIGIFLIALIGGGLAWQFNRPNNGQGFLSSALRTSGISQSDAQHRKSINELINDVKRSQQTAMDHIEDQKRFLESNNERMQSITEIAARTMEKSDADLLRLRSTMEGLEDHNRLLIERGQELIRANQEQLKQRMQNVSDASLYKIDSNLNRNRLKDFADQFQQSRLNYLKDVESQSHVMKERMLSLKERLREASDKAIVNQKVEVQERINEMRIKSDELLNNVEENQNQIRNKLEEHRQRLSYQKERLNDFIGLKKQQFEDTKDLIAERSRSLHERTQDQLEKLKQQREVRPR